MVIIALWSGDGKSLVSNVLKDHKLSQEPVVGDKHVSDQEGPLTTHTVAGFQRRGLDVDVHQDIFI